MIVTIKKDHKGLSYVGSDLDFNDQYFLNSLCYVLDFKEYSIVEAIKVVLDHFDNKKVIDICNNILALDTEMYYLDYFNNFLTVEKFSEYYNLSISDASSIIEVGRLINHKK